jgi:hypothetical protein
MRPVGIRAWVTTAAERRGCEGCMRRPRHDPQRPQQVVAAQTGRCGAGQNSFFEWGNVNSAKFFTKKLRVNFAAAAAAACTHPATGSSQTELRLRGTLAWRE